MASAYHDNVELFRNVHCADGFPTVFTCLAVIRAGCDEPAVAAEGHANHWPVVHHFSDAAAGRDQFMKWFATVDPAIAILDA